jgi:transposase
MRTRVRFGQLGKLIPIKALLSVPLPNDMIEKVSFSTGLEVSTIFTKPYSTDVLTDAQIIFIAQQLPSPKVTTGRPAYSNQELLPGILRVLRSGCRWRDLNLPGYPDGSTHWRRLRLWQRGLHFRWLWKRILKRLDEQNPQEKELRLKRLSIDGTLLQSFEFKEKTGYSGKHRRVGVKASLIVDATGLPLSVVLARGNAADIALAEDTLSQISGYDSFNPTATFLPGLPR